MSLLQAILMGLLQGITEFLPVSSSGHLAIFKYIFRVNTETGLLFDTLLQESSQTSGSGFPAESLQRKLLM